MKTIGAMLPFEAVPFELKQVPAQTDVSTLSKSTFEATLASNSPLRGVMPRTDTTAPNEPGLEQRRVQRRLQFDFDELPAENSRLSLDERLSTPPCGAHECDRRDRDWSPTFNSSPVATAIRCFSDDRENLPGQRLIASCSTVLRSPDHSSAIDVKPQDNLSVVPVKISEQQTHFLPTAKLLPVISSQVSDLTDSKAARPVFHPCKETFEAQPSRHESGHMPNSGTAGVEATDLPQINSMPLPVGSAALQVLSAVLVDSPSEPGKPSRVGAGVLGAVPPNLFAGSYYRMISIQLQPASLGLVQVVLKSTDRALSIRIEVESSQTRSGLDSDKEALVERIRAAGYLLDELLVVRMEASLDGARAQYGLPAFETAGSLAGSGSDNTQHRRRSAPTYLRETSDSASGELPAPESNRAAAITGLQGPGQRPPRLV